MIVQAVMGKMNGCIRGAGEEKREWWIGSEEELEGKGGHKGVKSQGIDGGEG